MSDRTLRSRSERDELEHGVQELDREHPGWNSREIETELRDRHPATYGRWRDATPSEGSRLRSIQRWRGTGGRALAARQAQALFAHVWPLGERQRQEMEPSYAPASRVASGSWRLFLFNCGPEVLREIHITLAGEAIGYSPFLLMERFTEIFWQRVPSIKEAALNGPEPSAFALEVRFVIARGTRNARIEGKLRLEPEQGWTQFDAGDGRSREIE
ncbi:MAG: hypothetical protein ACRECR_05130 [Thermoplasmata archaeon]